MVQGKIGFETKAQQCQSNFLIFQFLCDFWIFDTRSKRLIKNKKKYAQEDKQTTISKNNKQTNKHRRKA